jgi:hypothetical protein
VACPTDARQRGEEEAEDVADDEADRSIAAAAQGAGGLVRFVPELSTTASTRGERGRRHESGSRMARRTVLGETPARSATSMRLTTTSC